MGLRLAGDACSLTTHGSSADHAHRSPCRRRPHQAVTSSPSVTLHDLTRLVAKARTTETRWLATSSSASLRWVTSFEPEWMQRHSTDLGSAQVLRAVEPALLDGPPPCGITPDRASGSDGRPDNDSPQQRLANLWATTGMTRLV
jgi:hypothetical protein